MDRTQTACYFLIASAFVLAGLLVHALAHRLPSVQAEMLATRENYTALTVPYMSDDLLYIVDHAADRLLVYRLEVSGGRGRLELLASEALTPLFERQSSPLPRQQRITPGRMPR